MDKYRDPIIEKLLDLFRGDNGPKNIKKYFNGDVLIAPKSDLPLISIAKDATDVGAASNMEDDHLLPMTLTVLYDYTKDLSRASDVVAGSPGLYKIIEERDAETYQLAANSVLGILRANQTLDNKLWIAVGPNEKIQVRYGLGVNRRGPGIYSVEAVVRFNVRTHLPRLSPLN